MSSLIASVIMVYFTLALLLGLALLLWSADRFVAGAASSAHHLGMPPLLIGMLVIGFGTSAPEMLVSVLAAAQGNAAMALGNAYGSNIANIALILGATALIEPIYVSSTILRKELPILLGLMGLSAWQLWDNSISRSEAVVLLAVFASTILWSIWQGLKQRRDALGSEVTEEIKERQMPLNRALLWTLVGLIFLIVSSRMLVWGAVGIAQGLGVSDLIIGLTVVALGTSLPELASSVIAARKGEHDLALGNILGSNLFNTLAVVGLAGVISPFQVGAEVLQRDVVVMSTFTFVLFLMGFGFKGPGRINRVEGCLLLAGFIGYTGYLLAITF